MEEEFNQYIKSTKWTYNSVVELPAHNRLVIGSNPIASSKLRLLPMSADKVDWTVLCGGCPLIRSYTCKGLEVLPDKEFRYTITLQDIGEILKSGLRGCPAKTLVREIVA